MATTLAAPTCAVVRAGETYDGQQGLSYFAGISAETVGARALHAFGDPSSRRPRESASAPRA